MERELRGSVKREWEDLEEPGVVRVGTGQGASSGVGRRSQQRIERAAASVDRVWQADRSIS